MSIEKDPVEALYQQALLANREFRLAAEYASAQDAREMETRDNAKASKVELQNVFLKLDVSQRISFLQDQRVQALVYLPFATSNLIGFFLIAKGAILLAQAMNVDSLGMTTGDLAKAESLDKLRDNLREAYDKLSKAEKDLAQVELPFHFKW